MIPAWYTPPPYVARTGLEVVAQVARQHGFRAADLIGPSRVRPVCIARWRAMKELRERGGSLASIGRTFNRDHSTVSNGLRMLEIYG